MGMLVFPVLLMTENLSAQKNSFKTLLPDHIKVQYAGGMGFISFGMGYSSRDQKFEGDLFYGYLPASIGGVSIHSLSGKFSWIPFQLRRTKKIRIEPLVTGLLINYSFGKQYYSFDPPNYPYSYYGFPTAIHSALFLGSRAGIKRILVYYELISFDRDIVSLINNPKSLHISDIVTLAVGIRLNIE